MQILSMILRSTRSTARSMPMLFVFFATACHASPLIDLSGNPVTEIRNETVIALWPEGTEGVKRGIPEEGKNIIRNIHNPSLTIFKPEKPNSTAVIVMPGGGYGANGFYVEGVPTAQRLVEEGITVFILKYRIPATEGVNFKHPIPLMDAQRAIKLVRYHAETLKVNPDRIGIIGFSAGGHLASTAGTLFKKPLSTNDEIGKTSCRPDFMMLIYPLITTQGKGATLLKNLVGKNPDPDFYQPDS